MKRRRFIRTIAATAALALPGAIWYTLRPTCADSRVDLGMQNIFRDDCQIRALGEAYRHAYPGEDDVVLLQELLLANGDSTDLDKNILRDFEQENTVQLHGWILSRSEARRYALFSIRAN